MSILLNLKPYFNINLLYYNKQFILLYKIYKYNIHYKYMLIYIKNIIKKLFFNLKNKINAIKSTNKKSKTYYSSSHIAKKGLVWFGIRYLNLKFYNTAYIKILFNNIINMRSNINIYSLEFIKFLYYINILTKKNTSNLILNNKIYYKNFIIYNNYLLNTFNFNNINLIY